MLTIVPPNRTTAGQQALRRTTTPHQPTVGVCATAAAEGLFVNSALAYNPRDEDYAHLTAEQHLEMFKAKQSAETAAVDACYDCPLMVSCGEQALAVEAKGGRISGVVGGMTERERDLIRNPPTPRRPRLSGTATTTECLTILALATMGWGNRRISEATGHSTRLVAQVRRIIAGITLPLPVAATIEALVNDGAAAEEIPTMGGVDIPAEVHSAVQMAVLADKPGCRRPAPQQQATGQGPETVPGADQSPAAVGDDRAAGEPQIVVSTTTRFTASQDWSRAVLVHMADGREHHIDELVAVATPHLDDEEATRWWTTRNSTLVDGQRVLKDSAARVPTEERLARGRRLIVVNGLDARRRRGTPIERDGSYWTYQVDDLAAATATGGTDHIREASMALVDGQGSRS